MPDKDFLSPIDAKRIEDLGVVFENAEGGLLTHVKEESFGLVEPTTDSSIAFDSVWKMKLQCKKMIQEEVREAMLIYKRVQFLKKYGRVKMSPTLEDFLWSSEEGDDQIEFRSPVRGLPPRGQLMVVNSKQPRKKQGYDYCLAACEDGTVRWVHESECVNNGNRVWTVHWFDLRDGKTVYFGDRLQRPVRNGCINVVNNFVNKTVGGNFNWSGTQKMPDLYFLSTTDAKRLEELGIVFESAEGGLLTQVKEESFGLVELTTDCSIPDDSIWKMLLKAVWEVIGKAMLEFKQFQFSKKYGRVKMSPTLEDYLLSSEEGDDQIEFRSPVPDLPPREQLMVVNSKQWRKKRGYGYCLAACEDGTVGWVHESECVNNGNRVWTVHWFDLRGGGTVYFGDRLQRPVRNGCINVVNNNVVNKTVSVGGNFNWSGTQSIGPVNCGQGRTHTRHWGSTDNTKKLENPLYVIIICIVATNVLLAWW